MPREASSAALRQFVDLGGGEKNASLAKIMKNKGLFRFTAYDFLKIGFYDVKSEKRLHLTRQVQPDVD